MDDQTLRKIERAESAELSWHPEHGGRKSWLVFEDDKIFDLGPDPQGKRLDEVMDRTLHGRYYPADAVEVFGRFALEGREIRVGDRLVQKARLFGRWGGPLFSASVEVYVSQKAEDRFSFGYVTTRLHHGRGVWRADFSLVDGNLRLCVRSTSMPSSFWFWIGLPVARYLQLRARRRAVEEFRRV